MYLKATLPLCQLAAFNGVLTSLHFTQNYTRLLLSPLHPILSDLLLPSLLLLLQPFFHRGIPESKHFLHIKMWNSFQVWAGNRPKPAICPISPLSTSSSLSSPLSPGLFFFHSFHFFWWFICLFSSLDPELHHLTFHCCLTPGKPLTCSV